MVRDEELAREAQRGDNEARDALANRFYQPVNALCLRLRGEPESARDAAQDACLEIIEHIDRYDPQRPFLPWALGIARNVCLDRGRRERRRSAFPMGVGDVPAGKVIGAGEPQKPVPDLIAAEEDGARIREALGRLLPEQRRVIALRLLEGRTPREIGQQLGMTDGAVRVCVHRALRALREKVAVRRRATRETES